MNNEFFTDKSQVRRAFEDAASNYEASAALQHEIEARMLSRLNYIKHHPQLILDMGCGSGLGAKMLQGRYEKADIIAMDFALNMLKQAQRKEQFKRFFKRLLPQFLYRANHYVCADVEHIPLKNAACDMVWSNLVLQWLNDPRWALHEFQRVLKVNGLLMFSSFGPDTLKELRQAFSSVDGYTHVNRFIDMHDIGDMLVANGFADPVMDMEIVTLTYDNVKDLMRELKLIGAHNVTMGRRRSLMGKSAWKKVVETYESFRRDGRLPVTFEVIYGHAWKAQPRAIEDGRQVVNVVKRKG